jgi:hypothetical protein
LSGVKSAASDWVVFSTGEFSHYIPQGDRRAFQTGVWIGGFKLLSVNCIPSMTEYQHPVWNALLPGSPVTKYSYWSLVKTEPKRSATWRTSASRPIIGCGIGHLRGFQMVFRSLFDTTGRPFLLSPFQKCTHRDFLRNGSFILINDRCSCVCAQYCVPDKCASCPAGAVQETIARCFLGKR